MIKNTKWLIAAVVALMLVLAGAIFYITKQQSEIKGMTEEFDIQKSDLESEYSKLATQYEGYNKLDFHNDSLFAQYENERMKVQRLLEELRTVKSTNTRRIRELQKELATVRAVLRTYIIQVDSLNAQNKRLRDENQNVTQRYNEASQAVSQLSQEKKNLSDKVSLAAQLNATEISVSGLNKRGKVTKDVGKMTQIMINFKIARNVTAATGDKMVYLRIMKPDNDILTKNRMDLFRYENRDINYSCRKAFEYTGEETPLTLYWTVEEYLYPGDYRVDIFADGNLIGSRSFKLEK